LPSTYSACRGVTVSPDGAFLYAANQGSNDVFAYTINSTSRRVGRCVRLAVPGRCHAAGNCDAETAV